MQQTSRMELHLSHRHVKQKRFLQAIERETRGRRLTVGQLVASAWLVGQTGHVPEGDPTFPVSALVAACSHAH